MNSSTLSGLYNKDPERFEARLCVSGLKTLNLEYLRSHSMPPGKGSINSSGEWNMLEMSEMWAPIKESCTHKKSKFKRILCGPYTVLPEERLPNPFHVQWFHKNSQELNMEIWIWVFPLGFNIALVRFSLLCLYSSIAQWGFTMAYRGSQLTDCFEFQNRLWTLSFWMLSRIVKTMGTCEIRRNAFWMMRWSWVF